MFHKIKAVSALPDYQLNVQFVEGVTKTYDVRPLMDKWEPFKTLIDNPELYYSVEVDLGGYGIVWNDELDLSCNELFANGKEIKTPFDGLIRASC